MIKIIGSVNSGTTWYALHQTIERCKSNHNLGSKPKLWIYGEMHSKFILDRIEKLYPNEVITGDDGSIDIEVNNVIFDMTNHLDYIIMESMKWVAGDVVLIDTPAILTGLYNLNIQKDRDIIEYTLKLIEESTGVVIYSRLSLNRNEDVEYNLSYTHNDFEWIVKQNQDVRFIKLVKMGGYELA